MSLSLGHIPWCEFCFWRVRFQGPLLPSFLIVFCIIWFKTVRSYYLGKQRETIKTMEVAVYPRLERVFGPFVCGVPEGGGGVFVQRTQRPCLGLQTVVPWASKATLWSACTLLWMDSGLSGLSSQIDGGEEPDPSSGSLLRFLSWKMEDNKASCSTKSGSVRIERRDRGAWTGPGILFMLVKYYLGLLLLCIVLTALLSYNSHTRLKGSSQWFLVFIELCTHHHHQF